LYDTVELAAREPEDGRVARRVRGGLIERRPQRRPKHFTSIERLEERTLLSSSPHPRIINGEVVDENSPGIINGTPTAGFSAVGEVGDRSGPFCTGTLIGPRHVLTAGHCAEGLRPTSGRFTIAGSTYGTSQVFVHPNYNSSRIGSDAANDIAIFELSVSVAGVTPDAIFRGTPRVGEALILVGFGAGGTGVTGQDRTFGIKRAGTTPIDSVSQRLVRWTFDNNRESNTAPGDSGGPAYIENGSVFYVAGVTSGGDRADAGIGDHSFDTRVDYYAPWIDAILGSTSTPDSDPGTDPVSSSDDFADAPGADAAPIVFGTGGAVYATGTLETIGDRDVFQVQVSDRGNLWLDLAGVTGSLDTYLRVYNVGGTVVASDDDSGPGTDSRVALLVQPGVYYISAGAYTDSGTGTYQLVGKFSTDDHADTSAGSTLMKLDAAGNASATGTIGQPGDRDVFQFVAERGGRLAIDLQTGTSGFDPVLTVYDGRGRVVAVNDDWSGTLDSHLVIRVRAGSTYYVQAAGYGTSQGDYSVRLTPSASSRHGVRSATPGLIVVTGNRAVSDGADDIDDATKRPDSDVPESKSDDRHSRSEQASDRHVTWPSETSEGQRSIPSADVFDRILSDAVGPSL
jgi:hypothetical protein